jgi:hypothetical protein
MWHRGRHQVFADIYARAGRRSDLHYETDADLHPVPGDAAAPSEGHLLPPAELV